MSKYKCKYGLYHDKPCVNNEPSSNNGWTYTAYAKYLAPNTVDDNQIYRTYQQCTKSYTPLMIDRLPNKKYPPFSKDEAIGCVSLGLLHNDELARSYYNFCNIDRDFKRELTLKSTIDAAKTLYNLKDRHRNAVWELEAVEAYPLAFKLAPWDVYYCKKMGGKKASIFESIAFYLNAASTIAKGNKSVRMLLWLQLEDMNHWLLKFVPKNKWVKDYFGPDHDFVKNL